MTVRRRHAGGAEAAAAVARQAEADAAWRAHLNPAVAGAPVISGSPEAAEHEGQGKELERVYGEPSWNALLYASPEEQAKAERIIAARTRRAPAEVY